jgi:hypothetical protein
LRHRIQESFEIPTVFWLGHGQIEDFKSDLKLKKILDSAKNQEKISLGKMRSKIPLKRLDFSGFSIRVRPRLELQDGFWLPNFEAIRFNSIAQDFL